MVINMGRPPKNVLARRDKGSITVMGNKRFVLTLQDAGVTPERLANKINELLDAEKEITVTDPRNGSRSQEMVPDHAVLRTLSLIINNILRMKKVSEDPGGMNEDDKALMEMMAENG